MIDIFSLFIAGVFLGGVVVGFVVGVIATLWFLSLKMRLFR